MTTTLSEATRLARLEKTVRQQGYVIIVMLIAVILVTAATLYHWQVQRTAPDFDHIAVALSAFQITFAIAALYGFWALRSLTKEAAIEVAEVEVRRMVPPLVTRLVEGTQAAMAGNVPISDDDVGKIVESLGEEGENGRK